MFNNFFFKLFVCLTTTVLTSTMVVSPTMCLVENTTAVVVDYRGGIIAVNFKNATIFFSNVVPS